MKNLVAMLVIALTIVLALSSSFTVQEHEQALIIQLGKVNPTPITKAGLHWKLPFIQEVKVFDKRILQWDGDRGEIPTKDKKFIWVDTTARWRISDPLLFYKSMHNIARALQRMSPILEGATKDTISNFNLIESVRNSNTILQDIEENIAEAKQLLEKDATDTSLDELTTDVEQVSHGREKLSAMIAQRAREELKNHGIDLIDVQLRSIAYQESVEQKVFQSMIAERHQIATKIRSAGKGEEAKILGQLDLALKKIESEAYRKSEAIRGKAEAEAIAIFAESLKEDPAYFQFVKTLETYKKTLAKKGEFILSTDNAFFDLMQKGG